MLPPVSLWTSLIVFVACALATALGLRALLRTHATGAVRGAFALVVAGVLLAHLAWGVGPIVGDYPMSYWGAFVACGALVLLVPFAASLPLAVLVRKLVGRRAPAPPPAPTDAPVLSRRALLDAATASVPMVALGTGASGFVAASSAADAPRRVMPYASLPAPLVGLRILQLSDLHLGVGRQLPDLERLLDSLAVSARRPDLVVLTGDIAEDLRQLGPALELVAAFGARLGAFAALGNHEHIRGIREVRRIFDASRVPLLVDEGVVVNVSDAKLWIAGVDDPVIVHTDVRPLLRVPIERALDGAPAGAFRLLLCHRPEGFDQAAAAGCHLTLSGHTHGGQIGFAGKSAFEPLYPDGYLWGDYRRGESHLYTTAGFGAWFPVRFGCPAEAPLIQLVRV